MITLNILPEKTKKELKIIDILIGVKDMVMLILFGIIISAITLLAGKFFLQNHFNKTVNQNYLNRSLEKYSIKEIQEFNQEINTSRNIQKDFMPYSSLLASISNLSNDGIFLQKLEIKNKNEVTLRAIASRRENLTEFKNALDASLLFENFTIPLDILFHKEDIQFTLDLKLRL